MSTRSHEPQLSQSDESLDFDGKNSRASKWRSSIRAGIRKSKKTTQRVTKSIKHVQDRALESVQQHLPISSFSGLGTNRSEWSSNEGLHSLQRPLASAGTSSTLDHSYINTRNVPFDLPENVNLQSGWDSADDDVHAVFEPCPTNDRIANTLIADTVRGSFEMGQAVVTDLNENIDTISSSPGSPRPSSNLSGLDADKMFLSAHTSIFTPSTGDGDFPSLPDDLKPQTPDTPELQQRKEKIFVPIPTVPEHPPGHPPPGLPPPVHSEPPKSFKTPPPVPSRDLKSASSRSSPHQLPSVDINCLPDEAKTINRRHYNTIDMRKPWTINQKYEEQLELALDSLDQLEDQTDNEIDETDDVSELPGVVKAEPDENENHTESPYRSLLRETDSHREFKCQSRPDSFASLPTEGTGRSIDSSRGSWDLETSEETLDDNSLADDDYEGKERRKLSDQPNLTSRLRDTFRSTIRDAAKVTKVRDMVRYVKRPRSAIEKTSYRDSRIFQPNVMNYDRRRSQPLHSDWAYLPPPPRDASENEIKRRLIVQSLVKTEKSYISSLEALEYDYRQKLQQAKPPIVDHSQVEQMFGSVHSILDLHKIFEMALDTTVMDWDTTQRIGDIFIASFEKQTVLESYSNFINSLPDVLKLIQKLCGRKPFFEFCTQQQQIQGDNLNLYGLMLKPVQRFPQFLLILQDLLQATSFDHPDRVSLEGAVTSLDKLTEQLDQRSERLEQQQLFAKLVKLSKTEWADSDTGRVIRSGPAIEVIETRGDEESPVELREGVLILTDAGKLLFLFKTKKTSSSGGKSKGKNEIDGCKIKWDADVRQITIDDFSNDPLSERLGNRYDIQSNIDKIDDIERLAGEMTIDKKEISNLQSEISILRENLAKTLTTIGTASQVTITISKPDGSWKKHIRFSSAIAARDWIGVIRGVRIRKHNQLANVDDEVGATGAPWRTREEDASTTGAERVLPLYLGSICASPDVNIDQNRAENVTFLSYASPSLDGSILFWHGADDFIQICHIKPEDDGIHQHEHGEIFGRPVEPRIHSIEMRDVVSYLFQAYSAIWCFQMDGDVFAFQDSAPFARLGVTRRLTTMPVTQIISHMNVNFLLATKSGAVYSACLSDSGGSHSFQLSIISEVVPSLPNPITVRLIDIPIRSEVWCWKNGAVSVIKQGEVIEDFQCRELGHVPLSAAVSISSGVWVSRGDLPTLYLYHVHTKTLIQTYDLSHSAFTVQPSHTFGVSSLTTMANLLIAGTTSGIIIALPLPKLAVSKPSVVGPAHASLYGHTGRVHAIHSVIPKYFNSSDSGLDRVTSSANLSSQIHNDAALLFAIGHGQRKNGSLSDELRSATHVTLWRSCT